MYSVLIASLVGLVIGLVWNCFLSHERKWSSFKGLSPVWKTPLAFIILGGVFAGSVMRERIPLTEKVIAQATLGATRNADGSRAFMIENKTWYQHSYRFFPRNAEGALTPWELEANKPIQIVEDSSLDKVGSLTIWESERDPTSPLLNWAIIAESDRRITKYVFRVPPGTVVHHVDK